MVLSLQRCAAVGCALACTRTRLRISHPRASQCALMTAGRCATTGFAAAIKDHPSATTATESSVRSTISSSSISLPGTPHAPADPQRFLYAPRMRYTAPWRSKSLTDFLRCEDGAAMAIAHTYRHPEWDATVTLIPLRHFAHPSFFQQVDDLCAQHDSVLMEGRVPLLGAPSSTMVPPRTRATVRRPPEQEDDEGWEPREVERFFQPFSWGVAESPQHTVVHAADKYDYEKLPWWCSVRFSAPVVGSLAREQHCLDMIPPLRANLYKSFAVPWGAAHMPVLHEMLLDNGFENVGMCSLLVLKKIDGVISEGEYDKMARWQRRQARRVNYVYAAGGMAVLAFALSYVSVDYKRGPQTE